MNQPFDPYFKWMGIPPSERPVDFYRLLGVGRFEPDPEVIAHAADQRSAHIKSMIDGPHGKSAQRILTEIASARICLLTPETKADYDRQLEKMVGQSQPPARRPPPRPAAGAAASQPAQPAPASPTPRAEDAAENPWKVLAIALGAGTGLALIVVLVILLAWRGGDDEVAKQDAPPPGIDQPDVVSVGDPSEKPGDFDQTSKKEDGRKPEPKPDDLESKDDADAKPPARDGAGPDTGADSKRQSDPERDPKPKPHRDPKPKTKTSPAPKPKQETSPNAGSSSKPKKLPVPDDAALAKAEEAVQEVFTIERGLRGQKALDMAGQLFQSGVETRDDPAARFVLMRMAAELAAQAGHVQKTADYVDRIGEIYDVELLRLKLDSLEESGKTAGAGPQAQPANMLLLQQADALANEAIAADNYTVALAAIDRVAIPAARRTGDRRLTTELTNQRNDIRRMKGDFASVAEALALLKKDPDHAEANLTVGHYYCLQKENWDKGIAYLAKGSDQALAHAAKLDHAEPDDPKAQTAVGDAWWDLAEARDRRGDEKKSLKDRAVEWYRRAAPRLTGLLKAKAEGRVKETGATVGDWVLVFDGKRSFVGVPNFAYDGTVPITMEAHVIPASCRGYSTILSNYTRDTPSSSQRGGLRIGMYYERFDFHVYTREPDSSYAYPQSARDAEYSQPGKRYHVAGVYASRKMSLYVDGRLEATADAPGLFKPSIFPFLVGADPSQSSSTSPPTQEYFFDGAIEAVRISNVARYTQPTFTPPKNLALDRSTQLLLEFNQGEGETVPNAAATKHKAQIVGAQWMERSKWKKYLEDRLRGTRASRFGRRGFD